MKNYELLAENLREPMRLYIEHRIEPGGFLSAVLCNDLSRACGNADHINRYRLFDIVSWIYNEAPSTCWGSERKFNAWLSGNEDCSPRGAL